MSTLPINSRIAIVDDESLCRPMARLLRACRIEPVAYRLANDFLGDAAQPRFACLIPDVQLGGISGIELARRLAGGARPSRSSSSQLTTSRARERALAVGCTAYLRKSDRGRSMIEAVRTASS